MSEQQTGHGAPAGPAVTDDPTVPRRMEDVQPCGRLGEHDAHVWLTRNNTWCRGGGQAGTGNTPRVGRVARRQQRRQAIQDAAAKQLAADDEDDGDNEPAAT